MKTTPTSGTFLPRLATVACLLVWSSDAAAAAPYREETHGPRLGTRILHFFKDLAYGDNPNDRYRRPKQDQRPPQPQQHTYGAGQSGQRYNLDHPPVARSGVPQRQPQSVLVPKKTTPRDMPYASPTTAPAVERDTFQAGIGGQREDLPQISVKPKSTTAPKPTAPAPGPKPVEERPAVESTPPTKTDSPATPTPETKATGQIASNTPTSSNKPWQSPSTDSTATPSAPSTSSGATPPSQPSGSTAMTGSKTSKDGRVKSPYPPYNELDVSGLPAGSLAMDPTTGKVFRVP